MPKQRNVGLEIGVSLTAAVVFGTGLYCYLSSSMVMPQSSQLVPSRADASSKPTTLDDLELTAPVFEAFGAALATKNHEDAYSLMAQPYRDAFSRAAFRSACERSPFLAHAQRAGLLKTTRMALASADDQPALPTTVRGQGVLATSSGNIDASVTLLVSGRDAAILVLSLGGIPVLDGVSGPVKP